MAIKRPGKVGNRFRTIDEAVQQIASNPDIGKIVQNIVSKGKIDESDRRQLSPYFTSGLENFLSQVNGIIENERAYAENPQSFINKLVDENRSSGYANLTPEETSAKLEDLRSLADIKSAQKIKSYGTRLGPDPIEENRNFLNFIDQPIDTSGFSSDIQQLQELQSQQNALAEKNSAVDTYLNQELPDALKKEREAFLSGEADRQRGIFEQEIAPSIEKQANVRGLTDSGYIPTALTNRAAQMQSELDSLRAEVESRDYSTLADSAYKNKVRQLMEGQGDYRSALLNERNSQITDQQNKFKESQSSLDRNLEDYLTKQRYELQLKQQEEVLRRQKNSGQGILGKIASVGGSIAGGIAGGVATGGNPIAISAGAGAGGQLGGNISGMKD